MWAKEKAARVALEKAQEAWQRAQRPSATGARGQVIQFMETYSRAQAAYEGSSNAQVRKSADALMWKAAEKMQQMVGIANPRTKNKGRKKNPKSSLRSIMSKALK